MSQPLEPERDAAQRHEAVQRLEAELELIKAARPRDAVRAKKTGKRRPMRRTARRECARRDHRTLGRYLRQTPRAGWSSTGPSSRRRNASFCCAGSALLLTRVAERRCGTTWRRMATELGRVHAVTLTGTAGTVVQTTPPSDTAAGFLAPAGSIRCPGSPASTRPEQPNALRLSCRARGHTRHKRTSGERPGHIPDLRRRVTTTCVSPGPT